MYIGNPKKVTEEQWVYEVAEGGAAACVRKRFVDYSPGFLKVFDEALTNAMDHSSRDPTMTTIKVDYDIQTGEICVYNNGLGVPVVEHQEHKMYVPELIFGHLHSGSNYNDNEKRTGAGTNGLGIKLLNVFSKTFTVETVDSIRKKKFVQEYSDNMTKRNKPKVTSSSVKSYTKITFVPDFTRFGMTSLDKDATALINKRVLDCIACTNKIVNVYLNGDKLKGKGLSDYAKYYFPDSDVKHQLFYESNGHDTMLWEYIVVPWDTFEHVSFVNGNSTYQGGKHVDHIVYQIVNKIKGMLETKKKLKDVRPAVIKERLFLFLRATVVNPQFSSQTKELLTTQSKEFGLKVDVSDKFIEKIFKSEIVDSIVEFCKVKESMELSKQTDGKKRNRIFIPKLEDALWAGTARSSETTLILTEGLSAMTFAVWGRSVVGPERFGVFPLKGKLLNVRDASVTQLLNNEEMNNLKQIIGLQHKKEYTSTSDLRYGKVLILTDADTDGVHIRSLFVNFIHYHWPSLIKLNFIQTLRTPIVKAIRGSKVIEFYTEQDYHKWKIDLGNTRGYQIRYFKGLGTSKKEDAKDAFSRFNDLKIDYYHKDKLCDEAILLAFDKDKNVARDASKVNDTAETSEPVKCSDKRKKWLGKYNRNIYIDSKVPRVSYQDLINKELIHFSIYDNMRSIPSLCDGLKPSQRKILYYMLKNKINKSIKVAQLSGYVSAETSYHHGEVSLQQAIVNLAQNFVGSNNVNLLFPDGNHGSRLLGGKDAASARYIFTRLSDVTMDIFNTLDDPLLKYLDDDGTSIEPEWYIPVIPMALVNGCEGIGTGYSTFIPPYNPHDIIQNIMRVLDDKEPLEMTPYFKGFNGQVESLGGGNYCTRGRWQKVSDTQVHITELPIGTWVTSYKEFLETHIDNGRTSKQTNGTAKAKPKVLKDVKNKTRDENDQILFVLDFKSAETLETLINSGTFDKEFKLTRMFSTNNMYLFNEDLVLSKYMDPNDILLDFFDIRLEYYSKRRDYLIAKIKRDLEILQAKARFIHQYMTGEIIIHKKSIHDILNQLDQQKFPLVQDSYDYLTRLPIVSLTQDKLDDLHAEISKTKSILDDIISKTDRDLWKHDLNTVLKKLSDVKK